MEFEATSQADENLPSYSRGHEARLTEDGPPLADGRGKSKVTWADNEIIQARQDRDGTNAANRYDEPLQIASPDFASDSGKTTPQQGDQAKPENYACTLTVRDRSYQVGR